MPQPPRKRLRKGTRSCTECRRRKIKCTYNDNAGKAPCDGCLSRDVVCEAQDQVANLGQIREPTRERVDRLEVIVQNLSETVSELQSSARSEQDSVATQMDPDTYHDSSGEVPAEYNECDPGERPESCQSCISVQESVAMQPIPSPAEQANTIRSRLLSLVPSRDDVLTISANANDWFQIHKTLLPEPREIKSRVALIEHHKGLTRVGLHPATIGNWLVCLAISCLQLPGSFALAGLDPKAHASKIGKAIEDLLADDIVLRTLEGIECATMFAQLQKFVGRPKKGWIVLRRALSFAELLNLHSVEKTLKQLQSQPHALEGKAEILQVKSHLWHSICGIDRLLSLLLGLPAAATNFAPAPQIDPSDPHSTTRRIIWMQSEIANLLVRRDQLFSDNAAFEETAKVMKRLRAIQKTWPADWSEVDRWARNYDAKTASTVLFQTGHSFLILRAQLPYLLRAKDDPRFGPNATECLQACRDILRRYYAVRVRLNVGGFMSRSFDLHAFTASVIILLHDGPSLHMSTTDQALLENAKEAMKQAPDRVGAELTKKMIVSLNSIQQCLDGDAGSPEFVRLKLPMLGEVVIGRAEVNDKGEAKDEGKGKGKGEKVADVAYDFDSLDDDWFLQDS